MTSDDAHAKSFRLVASDEIVDIPAGAEQKYSLRGKYSNPTAQQGNPHEQVAHHEQKAGRRSVVDDEPAARIDYSNLRQEPHTQQADECHVPELNAASQMRFE